MRGSFRRAVDHVHDRRVAEPSERQAEVERRADHDDDVGLGLEQAARPRERELVIGGKAAAAQPVGEDRHTQGLDRGTQRIPRAGEVHVSPDDERGTFARWR